MTAQLCTASPASNRLTCIPARFTYTGCALLVKGALFKRMVVKRCHVLWRQTHINTGVITMTVTGLLIFLVVGAVAGWLAGTLIKGGGFGLVGNIVVGIIGAFIGGVIFSLVGLAAIGILGQIISATLGAVVLLALIRIIKQA
ncbi:transglycosylase associated gene [Cellvibrio japonicus Ueda107]|uniref:Transglycosylase associated protein n=2 Tax=Cellvibrio japonicus TaxID=155077 RepID=B3PG50_CELJU|nr:transglycosylase associated gene [Cellvibrio japonicus Ueda107]